MGLRISDLRAGGHYLYNNGNFLTVNVIDAIKGNTVYWHDDSGPGICTRKAFLKGCKGFAPDGAGISQTPNKEQLMTIVAQIAELRQVVVALSENMAAILKLNATLIKIILPLATELDADQEQMFQQKIEGLSVSTQRLQQIATALSNPPA
jgi:hypothetical protein